MDGSDIPAETPQELEHEPEDLAATFFAKQKPRLKNLLSSMSVKQIRRFVMHVASYPLNDKGDVPRTDAEKRAAHLFKEMVTNKTIMSLAAVHQQEVEKLKKEETEKQNGEET